MKVSVVAARITLAAIALTSLGAGAQTVYKCTDKNGNSVFTTDPCGKDAKLVTGSPLKPKTAADLEAAAAQTSGNPDPPKKRERTGVDDISDSVADSNCRRSASNAYVDPSTARIDNARAEIRRIENSSYYGTETQREVWRQGTENQIIGLRNLIATEEGRNDQLRKEADDKLQKALQDCDKAKGDREKAASQQ